MYEIWESLKFFLLKIGNALMSSSVGKLDLKIDKNLFENWSLEECHVCSTPSTVFVLKMLSMILKCIVDDNFRWFEHVFLELESKNSWKTAHNWGNSLEAALWRISITPKSHAITFILSCLLICSKMYLWFKLQVDTTIFT